MEAFASAPQHSRKRFQQGDVCYGPPVAQEPLGHGMARRREILNVRPRTTDSPAEAGRSSPADAQRLPQYRIPLPAGLANAEFQDLSRSL